jgi:hypothetical protein
MYQYYDREKLYEEVWENPMSEVCKNYGISDVALKKTCKKLRVATPPRGYWAKKASGLEPPKPKLIPFENPPKVIIRKTTSQGNDSIDEDPKLAPEAFEEAERLIQSLQIVQVSEDLEDLHPYVRNTRKVFKRQQKKGYYGIDYNRFTVSEAGVFKIDIGQNSIDRVSLILHSICQNLLANGFMIKADDEKGVVFQIMDENISIKISESSKKTPIPKEKQEKDKYYPADYEYIATGILKLEININSFMMKGQKTWTDGKTKSIESRIHEIIHQFIYAAAWNKETAAYHMKREEEWRIEEDQRAEKERLASLERERVSRLETGYKKWMYHKELSDYVNAVKSHYLEHNGKPEGDFAEWLKWAESYLENNSPLKDEYPKFKVEETKVCMW